MISKLDDYLLLVQIYSDSPSNGKQCTAKIIHYFNFLNFADLYLYKHVVYYFLAFQML